MLHELRILKKASHMAPFLCLFIYRGPPRFKRVSPAKGYAPVRQISSAGKASLEEAIKRRKHALGGWPSLHKLLAGKSCIAVFRRVSAW